MKFTAIKALLAASVLATFASSVSAGQATAVLTVNANVVAKCKFGSANYTMNFGTYTQENGDTTATTVLDLTCPVGTTYNIGIDGLTAGTRAMVSGGGPNLDFNLYQNPAMTTVWGNTVGTDVLAPAAMGATGTANHTIYGKISETVASRATTLGVFSTTLNVFLNF